MRKESIIHSCHRDPVDKKSNEIVPSYGRAVRGAFQIFSTSTLFSDCR